MLRKSVTQQYPEVRPSLPPRSRGVIALVEENCTSCMLCARECPDWCIYIDSHKETIPAPEGGRARQRNVLDRFAIDFALCMYCGICIEVCPFDALFWSPEFEYAEGDIRNLLHEKDRLATWVLTVPPPPAHDPGAEPPKELKAAPRRPGAPSARPTPPRRPRDETSATPAADRPATPAPERPAPPTSGPSAASASGRPAPPASDRQVGPSETTPSGTGPAEAVTPETGASEEVPSDTGEVAGSATTGEPSGAGPRRTTPSTEPPRSGPSSTGDPSEEELSTGSGEPRPDAGSEEQTAGPRPSRRRMADPRSIRPPGRLDPDGTKESKEDS
ncbi:NuoI/complex I 23 kDa subunit family protein [Nonomuraea cavernae]|uniref:NuoI/complex I 23 kDa subunit family protein n=1 Tax=Nonomuraea cavernae TaxID=2045107 RepID=UPI0033EB3CA8